MRGFVWGLVLWCSYWCPLWLSNHLVEEERVGWFAFIVMSQSVFCVSSTTVPMFGLQPVIVAFYHMSSLLGLI